MAIFSLIDLDAKKVEPLVVAILGAGALFLLYKHYQGTQAQAQADQAGSASSDYVNGIEDIAELQALTGGSTSGASTTGSSEQPTYSAPTSSTVSPTLNGGASTPAGTGAPSITFEIPSLPFSTVSTNIGNTNPGSGA